MSCRKRNDQPAATRINDGWAMDFVSDNLIDCRRTRLLTIVERFAHENTKDVGHRCRGNVGASTLERVVAEHEDFRTRFSSGLGISCWRHPAAQLLQAHHETFSESI